DRHRPCTSRREPGGCVRLRPVAADSATSAVFPQGEHHMRTIQIAAISCCLAGALACSNDRSTRASNQTPGTLAGAPSSQAGAPPDRSSAPITLVGCLQKSDGLRTSYMLTSVNEPNTSVGTSGETRPGAVEKEQLRAAANTYVLNPKGDVKLDDLVGK